MTIAPISGVSFKGTQNQLHFEGKKERKNHSGISNTLKSIPLATLIALSPLNTVEVNAQSKVEKPEWIGHAYYDANPVAAEYMYQGDPTYERYDKAYMENTRATLLFFSTDGDDSDAEFVKLGMSTPREKTAIINGKKVTYTYNDRIELRIKSLGVVDNQKLSMLSPYKLGKIYYVGGPGVKTSTNGISGDELVIDPNRKAYKEKHDYIQVSISEEFFNYIKEVMGNSIEYWEKTVE